MGYVGLPLAVGFAEAGHRRHRRRRRPGQDRRAARGPLARRGHPGRAPRRGAGALHVHDALRRAARGRGDPRLRPDAADAQPRARPRPAAQRLARARRRDREGPARRARVDDLPRHDTGTPRSAARGVGPARRRGLQPRLLARARRPRPHRLHAAQHAEGRRRPDARLHRPRRRALRRASATPSCPSPPPRSPSSRSCSRTSSARSTSRSSTRWRCSPTAWGSTSGRSSTPRRPSRSASRASIPGPGMGGHCLPVDPFYLTWKAREYDMSTEFIELAGKVNQAHAVLLPREDRAGAERRRQGGARREGARRRRRLQGRDERHARVAGAEDRRPARRARRRRQLPRPVRARDRAARAAQRRRSTTGSRRCDLAVIVTAHPGVDHEAIARTRAD